MKNYYTVGVESSGYPSSLKGPFTLQEAIEELKKVEGYNENDHKELLESKHELVFGDDDCTNYYIVTLDKI
jgi:hypothetical protein